MTPTYLYRKVSGQHTVGYFTPSRWYSSTGVIFRRKWVVRDVCYKPASAADRAVYLNGGTTEWSVKK